MTSKILLVCFVPKIPMDKNEEAWLFRMISTYGALRWISIFRRDLVLKAFVEPVDRASYDQILGSLGQAQFDLGQLSIFPSKKRRISNMAFTQSPESLLSNPEGDDLDPSSKRRDFFSQSDQEIFLTQSNFLDKFGSKFETNNDVPKENHLAVNCYDPEGKNPLPIKGRAPANHFDSDTFSQYLAQSTNLQSYPLSEIKDSESRIIELSEVDFSKVTFKMIENLFGAFGNIDQISRDDETPRVFVEYQKENQAHVACMLLKDCILFGCRLKPRTVISNDCSAITSDAEGVPSKVFKVPQAHHRFRKGSSVKMNPPSSVLHFSNLCASLDPVIFYMIVSQIHEPVKIKRRSSLHPSKSMFLAFFDSPQKASEVLAVTHNKFIGSKQIKVSFTHPIDA